MGKIMKEGKQYGVGGDQMYRKGDIITINTSTGLVGFSNAAGTTLYLTLPTQKQIDTSASLSLSISSDIYIRDADGVETVPNASIASTEVNHSAIGASLLVALSSAITSNKNAVLLVSFNGTVSIV